MQRIAFVVVVAAATLRGADARAQAIVVGGKNFTEQAIVAELTKQLLETRGFRIEKRTGFSTDALHREVGAGTVDVHWEYTGTSLILLNGVTERLDPEAGYARAKALDAARGLAWLKPSRVNNAYALAMRGRAAAQLGIVSISDLAGALAKGADLTLGLDEEFATRPDGLGPLESAYGVRFARDGLWPMEPDRVYAALRDSWVDVGLVYATDGRVAAHDFRLLVDDRQVFPNYVMAPVVRRAVLEREPGLAAPLEALAEKLDNAQMTQLNGEADLKRRSIKAVATEFLKRVGLM